MAAILKTFSGSGELYGPCTGIAMGNSTEPDRKWSINLILSVNKMLWDKWNDL